MTPASWNSSHRSFPSRVRSPTPAKHGNAAVLHRDVVDQFLNENGFADTGAAEQSDLAALQERLNQVDDFDSGLEHFESGGLIVEQRRRAVNRIVRLADERPKLIDGLAEHVHHAAKRRPADRNGDARAGVEGLHAANHAFGRLHGNGAHAAFAKVLLHFDGDVDRLGNVEAFARDANGVVNGRQVSRFKLNVEHRSNDLDDVSDGCVFLCHAFSYAP